MPLRVAFDLDGTIADMFVALRKEAEQLFGAEELAGRRHRPAANGATPTEEEPESKKVMAEMHLTARQQMQLWDHVKTIENFWNSLPEMEPGIVARIATDGDASGDGRSSS